MERSALFGFLGKKNPAEEFRREQKYIYFANCLRNLLTKIQTEVLVLTDDCNGLEDMRSEMQGICHFDNDLKKHFQDIIDMIESVKLINKKVDKVFESGDKLSSIPTKDRMEAIEFNYNMLTDVTQCAMDCKSNGEYNDNGKILLRLPEETFNKLKIPKYLRKEIEVYGSVLDRD